ncbi:MAG: hypothetical protein ACRDZ8_18660 [Acidimicrobiales bacterium]
MTVEQLLRDAMAEEAASIPRPTDRWDDVEAAAARTRRQKPAARARSRRVGGFTALAVAAAVAAALIAIPVLRHNPDGRNVLVRPAGNSSSTLAPQTTTLPRTTVPLSPPTTPKTTVPLSPVTTPSTGPAPGQGYLPLYPFGSLQQATAWLASYQATGAQPWHLDPGQTALSFAGFLGYTSIDKVISVHADGTGDHVAIGYSLPNGGASTAAVVHLRRFGGGSTDPWEVVGTDDTANFSITAPAYGAVTNTPAAAAGALTAVDPNVRGEVLGLSSATPLGTACCWPASSTTSPSKWSLSIPFRAGTDPVMIVAASNAGGLEAVGQFAVTGVRSKPGVFLGL